MEYTEKSGWWDVKFNIILDGEDISFDDLSDTSKEYILDCIKDGYYSGEIFED